MKYFSFRIILLFLACILIFLVFSPSKGAQAIREGLVLWYQGVLPTLFPFMILSGLFVRLSIFEFLPAWFTTPVCRLFHCSRQGAFAIMTGFFCGFPMGARTAADLFSQKLISYSEYKFLMGFTNNVSPAFLLSFLAAGTLKKAFLGPGLIFSILGASILYGIFTRPAQFSFGKTANVSQKKEQKNRSEHAAGDFCLIFDDCLEQSMEHTVKLGGYIVVFSLISAIFQTMFSLVPFFSKKLSLIFLCPLEITNAVRLLCSENLSFPVLFPLLCVSCAFGGISALAQTIGIAKPDSEILKYYIKSRVIITLLALLLSCIGSFILFFFFLCRR